MIRARFTGGPLDGREIELPQALPALLPTLHRIHGGRPEPVIDPDAIGRYELRSGLLVDWRTPHYIGADYKSGVLRGVRKVEDGYWTWFRAGTGTTIEALEYEWSERTDADPK